MVNRGILARIKQREIDAKKAKKKAKKKVEEPVDSPPVVEKVIILKNPDTGDVVSEYASIEKAVEAGFNVLNVKKALKNGTKYKGHLWEVSK